jgi:hypothetical protein
MLSFLFRKSATTKGLTLYRKENRGGTKIAFEEKDEFFIILLTEIQYDK